MMPMNKLMQLMVDNVSTQRAFRIENATETEATVYIYDGIGDWIGVAAKDFVPELRAIKANTIHLRINSPGGDVFDGRAIMNALRQHPAKVIAHIDGLAASAASTVMLGADEIRASAGSFVMVHRAMTLTIGNTIELRATADMLAKIDGEIMADYEAKTGKDRAEVEGWMAQDTWFTADEALEAGLIDSVVERPAVKNAWNLAAFENVPEALNAAQTDIDKDIAVAAAARERRLRLLDAAA